MAGWAFKPLPKGTHVRPLTQPGYNDGKWPRMRIGIWNVPHYPSVREGLFRRKFTVPVGWNDGRVSLWLQSFYNSTFMDQSRIFLDGKMVANWSPNGLDDEAFGDALQPGTTHVLAVQIAGISTLDGFRGNVWISYRPHPLETIDLAGTWRQSTDFLHYQKKVHVPGVFSPALGNFSVYRRVKISRALAGRTIFLHANTISAACFSLYGVLINGVYVASDATGSVRPRMNINITPFLHFGQSNTIELLGGGHSGRAHIRSVRLLIYRRGSYP